MSAKGGSDFDRLVERVSRWAKAIREMNRVRLEMRASGRSVMRRSREAFGISMRKFAKELGKENTFPMISKIECGKEPLTRPIVLLLDTLFKDAKRKRPMIEYSQAEHALWDECGFCSFSSERSGECDEVGDCAAYIKGLRDRLMLDLKGEPHVEDCIEYADALVDKDGQGRFGDLSRLEWMLRAVVMHNKLLSKPVANQFADMVPRAALVEAREDFVEIMAPCLSSKAKRRGDPCDCDGCIADRGIAKIDKVLKPEG